MAVRPPQRRAASIITSWDAPHLMPHENIAVPRTGLSLVTRQLRRPVASGLAWALLTSAVLWADVKAAEAISGIGETECAAEEAVRWRGGTARLENDLFAGTDRNYTNGVSLTTISHDMSGKIHSDCLPRPLNLYTRILGWPSSGSAAPLGDQPTSQNLAMRVGQVMYTPDDHTRTDLIEDDRPYAGLLYLGVAWNRRFQSNDSNLEVLDSRELTLGVIGPLSLAEQSQDLVHKLRGIDQFQGWDHQLHNEPAFQVATERKFRALVGGAVRQGWSQDVIGSYALRLGNIETAASAGVELRMGWNIPNDFGSYPIRPGGENRPPSAAARLRATQPQATDAPRPGVHLFTNFEAKAVAWDFSLDGNLLHDSHHVTRRPLVSQAAVGISSQWFVSGHGFKLAVMRVWRTREFEEQKGSHAFGSIAVSVEF